MDNNIQYASFGRRLLARLIDLIPIGLIYWGLNFTLQAINPKILFQLNNPVVRETSILSITNFVLYFTLSWRYLNGQTLGDKILKNRIVSLKIQQISLLASFIRAVFLYLLILSFAQSSGFLADRVDNFVSAMIALGIVYVIINFYVLSKTQMHGSNGRWIHDLVSRTMVIKA